MTPNELFLTFGGLHLCVKFGENRHRNATVRVMTHGQTHRQTQTDFIICPIAICYSYGADKNFWLTRCIRPAKDLDQLQLRADKWMLGLNTEKHKDEVPVFHN